MSLQLFPALEGVSAMCMIYNYVYNYIFIYIFSYGEERGEAMEIVLIISKIFTKTISISTA